MEIDNIRRENLVYVIFLAQRFEYIVNHYLAEGGLTTKQLILLATIMREPEPPSLATLASKLKVSYQNIKQIANLLVKKGFIDMIRDTNDKRTYRLVTTEYNKKFWQKRDQGDTEIISKMFEIFSEEEQIKFHDLVTKLLGHNDELFDLIKENKE